MGLYRSLARRPRLLLVTLLALIGYGTMANGAVAQDDTGDTIPLNVIVWKCLGPGCTEDSSLVEGVDGVVVTATDADAGTEIGSCTTGDTETGACVIEVPSTVTNVTLSFDETTIPEGFSATDNPTTFSLADTTEYPFLLMPEGGFPDDADPEPTAVPDDDADAGDDSSVSQLPETGSGSQSGSSSLLVTGMVALASTLGLIAMVARRALGRR